MFYKYIEFFKKKYFFIIVQKGLDQCILSRIIINYILRGGKIVGEFKEFGMVDSVEDCIEKCCREKICEVVFLVDNKCYFVECYGDEFCQSVFVEDEKFFLMVVYMNKRNGKRMKDKGKVGNQLRKLLYV